MQRVTAPQLPLERILCGLYRSRETGRATAVQRRNQTSSRGPHSLRNPPMHAGRPMGTMPMCVSTGKPNSHSPSPGQGPGPFLHRLSPSPGWGQPPVALALPLPQHTHTHTLTYKPGQAALTHCWTSAPRGAGDRNLPGG